MRCGRKGGQLGIVKYGMGWANGRVVRREAGCVD